MSYDNSNSGILTKNDKGDNPKRPDYRGSAEVDGKKYWVSGWIMVVREDTAKMRKGDKFMSLKFQEAEQQGAERDEGGDVDDDIPF